MDREEILLEAERHFLAAMISGWAAGVKGMVIPDMPGYILIVYEQDDFRVADRYCVSIAGKSAGTTTIWYVNDPVWVMFYGGFYREEDMPFLKRALMHSYTECLFNGGRGPEFLDLIDGLRYSNCVGDGSTFSRFFGRERLISHERTVGWHEYQGMSLI